MADKKKFYEQKTFWAGAAAIVTAVLGIFSGQLTPEQSQGVLAIVGGLGLIFARQAIEGVKGGDK